MSPWLRRWKTFKALSRGYWKFRIRFFDSRTAGSVDEVFWTYGHALDCWQHVQKHRLWEQIRVWGMDFQADSIILDAWSIWRGQVRFGYKQWTVLWTRAEPEIRVSGNFEFSDSLSATKTLLDIGTFGAEL